MKEKEKQIDSKQVKERWQKLISISLNNKNRELLTNKNEALRKGYRSKISALKGQLAKQVGAVSVLEAEKNQWAQEKKKLESVNGTLGEKAKGSRH